MFSYQAGFDYNHVQSPAASDPGYCSSNNSVPNSRKSSLDTTANGNAAVKANLQVAAEQLANACIPQQNDFIQTQHAGNTISHMATSAMAPMQANYFAPIQYVVEEQHQHQQEHPSAQHQTNPQHPAYPFVAQSTPNTLNLPIGVTCLNPAGVGGTEWDSGWMMPDYAAGMLKYNRESNILAVAPYSANKFVQPQGMASASFHQQQYYGGTNQSYCIPPNASFWPTTNSEPLISELNRQMGQFSGLPAQQNNFFQHQGTSGNFTTGNQHPPSGTSTQDVLPLTILLNDRDAMLKRIKNDIQSPIIDFLCQILAEPDRYGHICSFIGDREFHIHKPKAFTELLNLRSRQKEKSYLQIARALKSYEERRIEGSVMMRKVPIKRNQFKFFPDEP